MITHDMQVAANAGRIVKIVDGELSDGAPVYQADGIKALHA